MFRVRLKIALVLASLLALGVFVVTPLAQTYTQTSKFTVSIDSNLTKILDLSESIDHVQKAFANTLTNGTGSGQANNVWHDQRTLTASSTEDLDLAGVLVSSQGQTLTFTKLKAFYVHAASANTNNVVVSRPASAGVTLFSAASDAISVLPDGQLLLTAPGAGITVTATTADLITITNSSSGTSVTYDVVVVGVT